MKYKLRLKDKWKSLSIYTKNKETIIRYWGGLKFDWFTIHAGGSNDNQKIKTT